VGRKGITYIELLMWLVGVGVGSLAYMHATFSTYRETNSGFEQMNQRFNSLENLIKEMKR
jgi:hypothetical protein